MDNKAPATPATFDRKKTIRRAVDYLHKYATDDQVKAVAALLNTKIEDITDEK